MAQAPSKTKAEEAAKTDLTRKTNIRFSETQWEWLNTMAGQDVMPDASAMLRKLLVEEARRRGLPGAKR